MFNSEGRRVYLGSGHGKGGDLILPSSKIYYCGKRMNQCRCGRCDGQCGPTNGCPCTSCKNLIDTRTGAILNRDGVCVVLGSGRGVSHDIGIPTSMIYYCGRWMNQCRCGNCDGQCGPTSGCPCDSCKALIVSDSNSAQHSLNIFNNEGVRVNLGVGSRNAGDIKLPSSQVYYCGRRMNQCRCGTCDGTCGPTNGCPCNSCKALILPLNKSISSSSSTSLMFNRRNELLNTDGVRVFRGSGAGSGGDVPLPCNRVYYCGRKMFQCRCGNCDGRCGPNDGCPCHACKNILEQSMLGVEINNAPNHRAIRGEVSGSSELKISTNKTISGSPFLSSMFPSFFSQILPQSQSKNTTTNNAMIGELSNDDGFRVFLGSGLGSGGDLLISTDRIYYCGRNMNNCRCGKCDGQCGPTSGCPCNSCKRLLDPETGDLINNEGSRVFLGSGRGTGGDIELSTSQIYYCGRHMEQCRCGKCDGQCGPTSGCPCRSCKLLVSNYPTTRSITTAVAAPVSAPIIGESMITAATEIATITPPVAEAANECVICFSNRRDATIVHGDSGHMCCCYDCAQAVKNQDGLCPMCRRPIDLVVKLYF